uniref:(northern house mosquito) hypothetical protein n=2 Tax=Culex pipiens TaxID=7175 RepID=A0A8D8B700_CULPI
MAVRVLSGLGFVRGFSWGFSGHTWMSKSPTGNSCSLGTATDVALPGTSQSSKDSLLQHWYTDFAGEGCYWRQPFRGRYPDLMTEQRSGQNPEPLTSYAPTHLLLILSSSRITHIHHPQWPPMR